MVLGAWQGPPIHLRADHPFASMIDLKKRPYARTILVK